LRRDSSSETVEASTISVVERFNDALNRHDADAAVAEMTEDCVFENTFPAPDGERHVGRTAILAFWRRLLTDSPDAAFDVEDIFATGDRCVVRWRYHWADDQPGKPGHVRGVDVFRVRAGKIAEKLSYVKG
jgi:ketosteroid isomerase-like protein